MYHRIEVSCRPERNDPRGDALVNRARSALGIELSGVRTRDVFSLYADLGDEDAHAVASAFANEVVQDWRLGTSLPDVPFDWAVVVGFRPGVTDNVARSARAAVADILGRPLRRDEEVYTSIEYFLAGDLDRDRARHIAVDLLANDLIQTTAVLSREQWKHDGPGENRPRLSDAAAPQVRTIDLQVSDEQLQRISREGTLALALPEMQALKAYFAESAPRRREAGLGGNPTDVELEVLAQTWSEHCKHKIFNARIRYNDTTTGETRVVESCFKEFIRTPTEEIGRNVDWLLSVFHDNSGVIRFNDRLSVCFKVETHNSPTALDPYGGANTGIVGVNRDPMGTGQGADLLLNVWGYCFASPFTPDADVPSGLFHPRRLRDDVHRGVIDGGNQSGIPYMTGWEYFDPRFLGKPLVYCGTVGVLPAVVNDRPGESKEIRDGDRVVMIGGRIGKDGIHGATFSSEELHQDSPVQAVQIGDPITQKLVSDFVHEARDLGLFRFITDNGAGGLSSSVGEMAEIAGGCTLELSHAPLKYAGLQPWEILVSEAQERMSLAVPPDRLADFLALAHDRDVEATVLGEFRGSGLFHVTFQGETVCHLDVQFMHDGLPRMEIPAVWTPPSWPEPEFPADLDAGEALLRMLGRLNICSGEAKARQYDHEVKGISVVKPYVGMHGNVASDATVCMIEPCSREGLVLAAGVAPRYSDIDTYHMVASAVDMAIRRTVAVGGDLHRIAGLDNFCWPDPVESEKTPDGAYKAAQLVRANLALAHYARAFACPCISGKDSMKNDSTLGGRKISIPPTMLFSTIAVMRDIGKSVTLDLKRPGDLVYVLGVTGRELGGSEFFAMFDAVGNRVPTVDAEAARSLYEAVAQATQRELVRSLHTPGFGGLGVAFAKSAIAGGLGVEADLDAVPVMEEMSLLELLFSESNSRFLATVAHGDRVAFEKLLAGQTYACIGQVVAAQSVTLASGGGTVLSVPLPELTKAYTEPLAGV